MKVNQADWNKYVQTLSAISKTAGNQLQAWIDTHGMSDMVELINYAYALVEKYGVAGATLAAEMYDAIAASSGVSVPTAELADIATYGEIAKAMYGTVRQNQKPSDTMQRLVKLASADTMRNNAIRDGAEWAWIPSGDTCAFCMMLASRGWQRASKRILKGNHADHIHAHCDCQFMIRFNSDTDVEGYDPEKYLEEYNAAGGDVNAMRRARYAENKDKINAQKRAAYAQKNGGGVSGAYTNINDSDGRKREKAANDFYKEIRNRKPEFEIKAVAKNSGMDESDVERIFNHVFLREHKFEDGSIKRFDPDYYMQNSWMRLREGKSIQPHDLILLQHELAEEKIMGEGLEIIYEVAHNKVEKKYNYAKALMEYLKDHDA